MICDKILLYFYNELEGEELNQFNDHLIDCKDCQYKIKELEKITSMYKQTPDEEPSPEVLAKILHTATKRKIVYIRPRFSFAVGIATTITIFTLVYYTQDKSYLAWNYNLSNEIAIINEKIEALQEENGFYISIDEKIKEVEEKVSNMLENLKPLKINEE